MAKILLLNQGNTHNYGDAANNSFKSLEYLSDKIIAKELIIMLFSNFTEKARISIKEAHDSAIELGHNYIGSEHLLAGLLREGSGVAAKVLEKSGEFISKAYQKENRKILP